MSFTILFAMLAILILIIVFAFMYFWKGLKPAFIVTGAALILLTLTFVVAIGLIVRTMPN